MRRHFALVLSLALLLGLGAQSALAQDSPQLDATKVKDLVQPSIVFLVTDYTAPVRNTNPEDRGILFGGEPLTVSGRCTGFFVSPNGDVATAAHCIIPDETQQRWLAEAAAVELWEQGAFGEATIEQAVDYGRAYFKPAGRFETTYHVSWPTTSTAVSREERTQARRIGFRPFLNGDIGLLRFEAGGQAFPGLELAEGAQVDVGTDVVAVGYPGNVDDVSDATYSPSFTAGKITRIGTQNQGSVAVYQHDAAVSGGMSGGPVVDSDGRVVGVTSFGHVDEPQPFNFATPVALLGEVLGDKAVTPEVGAVGETYREGVAALYDGDRDQALDSFREVQSHAGNPAVAIVNAGLLTRAEALEEDSGISPWIIALIVALGIAAIIAVIAIALSRRGGQPKTARPLVAQPAVAAGGASAAALRPGSASPQLGATTRPRTPAPATSVSGAPTPAVLVLVPSGDPKRFEITGDTTIGREGVDIVLADDDEISRKHATLRLAGGRLEIEDNNSSNGTEVNGKRIDRATVLQHGDTVTVGGTDLKVELPPDSRSRSAATTVKGG